MTPFQALYDREPPNMMRYLLGSNSNDMVEQHMLRSDEVEAVWEKIFDLSPVTYEGNNR